MTLTVACIQMNSGSRMEENLLQAEEWIRAAAGKGAEFVLLPENAFLMHDPAEKANTGLVEEAAHPAVLRCRELARELEIRLLIGSVALASPQGGKAWNRSLLINPAGEITARYDKIHLFDVDLGGGEKYEESARIAGGEKAVVAALPWGKLGLSICYDVRFPQLYRMLAQAGADFLAVPAAFTAKTGKAHWHVLLRARAIENGCFVFAPAQCGDHPGGRRTFGHALIVSPWGEILADAGEAPGMALATIDPAEVARARRSIPSLSHDRAFALLG